MPESRAAAFIEKGEHKWRRQEKIKLLNQNGAKDMSKLKIIRQLGYMLNSDFLLKPNDSNPHHPAPKSLFFKTKLSARMQL
jgi:hypothetical protein